MKYNRTAEWQGMNWCRQDKRLAIYLRDGLACVWCGQSVDDGVKLSLDHLIPHSKGGKNHEHNLVTCCSRCNSQRGNRSVNQFAKDVAAYVHRGATAKQIVKSISLLTSRPLDSFREEARRLIERRGSAAKFLASK